MSAFSGSRFEPMKVVRGKFGRLGHGCDSISYGRQENNCGAAGSIGTIVGGFIGGSS